VAAAAALLHPALEAAAHDGVTVKLARADAAVQLAPSDAALRFERAELHRIDGNWRAALHDLLQAEALDPTLRNVDLARARVFLAARDGARAVLAVRRHLDRHGEDALAQALLAQAHGLAGEADLAGAAWSRAVELAPDDPNLHFARSEQLRERGDEWRAAALATAEHGARRTGAIQLEELALRREIELGRFDAALDRISRLAAGSPRPDAWLERRLDVLEQSGRAAEALLGTRDLEERIRALPAAQRSMTSTRERGARLLERRLRLESNLYRGMECGKR
jgi:tetratricopeptide (TPR) repeat protein